MDHKCPKDGCMAPVPVDMLACRQHWYSVPKPIRMAVWRAWDNGAGAGTPEHTRAIEAAVSAMNRSTGAPRVCCESYPHYCPGCQRVMSHREAAEQDACNDCHAGVF